MAVKENAVQRAIMHYLLHRGTLCWRNNNTGIYDPIKKRYRAFTGMKGVSDILGVLPGGRVLAIECKSKTGRVSDEQKIFMERVNNAGGFAFVARSIEDVIKQGL